MLLHDSDVVTATNFHILVFDRNGDLNINRSKETPDFFIDLGLTYEVDPFCVFDASSERWFFAVLTTATKFGLTVSKGESLDLHDTDDWWTYEWDPPGSTIDYPSMSIGDDHVFMTYYKEFTGPGLAGILYIDKAELLDGGNPPALTIFDITAISEQDNHYARNIGCVREYDEINSGYGYFVTDSHTDPEGETPNDMVRLYALDTATDTLEHFDVEVPEYRTSPKELTTPDGSIVAASFDFKFPIYRNGSLWIAHQVGIDESDDCQIQWYEIKINGWPVSDFDPALEQSGLITAASRSAFHPALHVDDEGNMAITYSECSASVHPTIYRRIRKWYDDDGELRTALLLKQSTGSPEGTNERWADFTCMTEDPSYPGVMWSHNEWFAPGTDPRKTWLARTDLNQSLTLEVDCPTCEGNEIERGSEVDLTVSGAAPGNLVRWYWSTDGCGSTVIMSLGVTIGIDNAQFLGSSYADSSGQATKHFTVPTNFDLGPVDVQAAELENPSEIIRRVIIE